MAFSNEGGLPGKYCEDGALGTPAAGDLRRNLESSKEGLPGRPLSPFNCKPTEVCVLTAEFSGYHKI
jgi:hypothetical protein